LIIGVAGDRKLSGRPLFDIIDRYIVGAFALLLRRLTTCLGGDFLIRSQAQGSCLVEPLAALGRGFKIGRSFP